MSGKLHGIAVAVPFILLAINVLFKKIITNKGKWEPSDFYAGLDLSLAGFTAALVFLFDFLRQASSENSTVELAKKALSDSHSPGVSKQLAEEVLRASRSTGTFDVASITSKLTVDGTFILVGIFAYVLCMWWHKQFDAEIKAATGWNWKKHWWQYTVLGIVANAMGVGIILGVEAWIK
jgi:hypothetical protein